MADSHWFFYSGVKPVPVELPDGSSVMVRARGHVQTTLKAAAKTKGLQLSAPPAGEAVKAQPSALPPAVSPEGPAEGSLARHVSTIGKKRKAATGTGDTT